VCVYTRVSGRAPSLRQRKSESRLRSRDFELQIIVDANAAACCEIGGNAVSVRPSGQRRSDIILDDCLRDHPRSPPNVNVAGGGGGD